MRPASVSDEWRRSLFLVFYRADVGYASPLSGWKCVPQQCGLVGEELAERHEKLLKHHRLGAGERLAR